MADTFEYLISEYIRAEKKLSSLFEVDANPSIDTIKNADKILSIHYNQLFDVELTDFDSHINRINFLLDRLKNDVGSGLIPQRILNKIYQDLFALKQLAAKNGLEPEAHGPVTNLIEICYTSVSKDRLENDEFVRMCEGFGAANAKKNIKGVLTFDNETQRFFQVLEGPRDNVESLIQNIFSDRRHHDIEVRFKTPIKGYFYKKWDMCLLKASEVKEEAKKGMPISDLLNMRLDVEAHMRQSHAHIWFVNSLVAISV